MQRGATVHSIFFLLRSRLLIDIFQLLIMLTTVLVHRRVLNTLLSTMLTPGYFLC
jgi:hypothetical protein